MVIGNARVSAQDYKPEPQLNALHAVGCEKIFT